jgi:tetratricopeptide (TPR) repeat protein
VTAGAGRLPRVRSMTQTMDVADAGYGYGVVGGDMHVFQDRGPVYLLGEYRRAPRPDAGWLLTQPSRMLNARYAVVGFTGRGAELDELERWRDDTSGQPLAARWLHAHGGQGKTRLAAELADRCAEAGFKVVTATHTAGAAKVSPGSEDLRVGGARGVLVVVDYADRWPLSHLGWLFSNALFGHGKVPIRLLLLARSAQTWAPVRAVLGELHADTSEQRLGTLPGGDHADRSRMFAAARDSFAACYGITRPDAISPPGPLSQPEFGLTLTVHMAALAAVDAHANGTRPPWDTAGLSAYLLDRERAHWTRMYENRVDGFEYLTPPGVMARAVFTAALTGAASHERGTEILGRLDTEVHPDRLLADHAACYPPADPATVLEPLYPDRLAEDFLALTLPGHAAADYQPQPWAPAFADALAARGPDGSPPAYGLRMITFLAAAAVRWPHVAGTLRKILAADPAAAVAAGGPILATLAEVTDLDAETLALVEPHLPSHPNSDLDLGIAALARRIAAHRLSTAASPADKAAIHTSLAARFANAGLHDQAAEAAGEAVTLLRPLAEADPEVHRPDLAAALDTGGRALTDSGDFRGSLPLLEEAVAIRRRLAEANPAAHLPGLAASLHNLSRVVEFRDPKEAVPPAEEALAIRRGLADVDPGKHLPDLATALSNAAIRWHLRQRLNEALAALEEATAIRRTLAERDPSAYLPDLATSLNNLGTLLNDMGRPDDAIPLTEEAVAIRRRLADMNPAFLRVLALSLHNLDVQQAAAGRPEAGLPLAEEAIGIQRKLAAANPAVNLRDLAVSLRDHAHSLRGLDRAPEALPLVTEAVATVRELAAVSPVLNLPLLGMFLTSLGGVLAELDRVAEARAAYEEAVAIRRQLAEDDPRQLDGLMISLVNLRDLYQLAGLTEHALALSRELIDTDQALVRRDPAKFRAWLATELVNYAVALRDLGHSAQALGYAREGVEVLRALAEEDPSAYRLSLAHGLAVACSVELMLGHVASGRSLAEESTELYRDLGDNGLDARRGLAATLFALGAGTLAEGSRDEGLASIDESLGIYARLAREDPARFKAEFKDARKRARLLKHGAWVGIVLAGVTAVVGVVLLAAYAVVGLVVAVFWRLPVWAARSVRRPAR